MPYLFLAINIVLMAAGQLLFKQSAIFFKLHEEYNLIQKYLLNPWFYGAIFLFGVSTFFWVKILTILRLSIAYPLLTIAYILTTLGAFLIFGERISLINSIGILCIMIGVSLVSIK